MDFLHKVDRAWLIVVGFFIVVAATIGLLTSHDNMVWYNGLNHPAATPPNWVFPLVWTGLYVLLASILTQIWKHRRESGMILSLGLFAAQMILNWSWNPIFFVAQSLYVALFVLIAMIGLSLLAALVSAQSRPMISLMWLPYVAWLGFALYLNWGVIALNV